MPPEVGKAGSATGPVVIHGSGEVEQPKSPDLKNKPAEQKQESTSSKAAPYRATSKEASNRKAELAAGATSQQTSIWKNFNNIASKASEAVGELTANAAKSVQQQDMQKLSQREYRQDMIPGENFEVEKITPGTTNKTQTKERVEDLSRGDVSARRYHPEQYRESTKSGLEDRLKHLNQGKELTPFEQKLVQEWDPNKKDGVVSLSPVKAVDPSGTKGPLGVQGYRVERGEADSKYRQVSYYDRDGNELVQGPSIQKQKMQRLAKADHPQDMVPGENFEAEIISPGSTNETKSSQRLDVPTARIHSAQQRTSTKAGLENRLSELNQGKELTQFEKKLIEEWPANTTNADGMMSISPIKSLDSTGTRGSTELEGYKVVRGGSGHQRTTFYDRQGNQMLNRTKGGEAISTDGPMDYIALGSVAGKLAVKSGKKIGEKVLARETASATKAETKAAVQAAEQQVAKAETGSAARTAEQQAAKVETETAAKSKANEVPNKGNKTGNKPDADKDSHVDDKKPAESTKRDVKGANVSKTNRMARPMAEIDEEIAEAQAELGEVRDAAVRHLRQITRGGEVPLGATGIEGRLGALAEQGDEVAAQLLRELEEVKRRLRNLHREKGVLKGDPEYLP